MGFWNEDNKNRKAAVAGKFYPGTKTALENELENLFAEVKKETSNTHALQALISPHAGYVFSGRVAASAFNQIPENAKYQHVFVLASSHQYHFNGAAIFTKGNYETPLGEIEVDKKLGKLLEKACNIFKNKKEAHEHEHSLEVQLPFLQYKLGNNFKLVPIILGTNNSDDCKKLAEVLKPYFTPNNLFVISTDFSHYPDYDDANKIDYLTANSICRNKAEDLLNTLKEAKSFAIENLATSLCGWTSVLTLLYLTEKANYEYSQIKYQNSGDAKKYGDKKGVVGYWAIAVYDTNTQFNISENEKAEILQKARKAITKYIQNGKRAKIVPPESEGILNDKNGAFVSVYIKNELRGCIGGFAGENTLNELIQEMAVSSVCDRRFDTINADDLKNMSLEVSILSPLKKINSAEEIELGRHGIYIKSGFNTGTFLPQVADKTGWNVNEFLGRCSRDKAGIGWEGWKTAELFTYEAIIIKDS
jgi:AmmeMemoRadiSam system protein B/AmmeMemoRadiSam system protein A